MGKDYITNESGDVFFQINILGHVKNPGTYFIYEGADIFSVLSLSGGPLPGAKLDKIKFFNKSSNLSVIDLREYVQNGNKVEIDFKPNDTIYVEQTVGSFLFTKSNIINSLLQILNIVLVISNF